MSTGQIGGDSHRMNVLSIDGGGIRGVIPAAVLAEIESRTGKPICHLFDVIAGTSTGGILALGLSKPKEVSGAEPEFSASDLLQMYKTDGHRIFPKRTLQRLAKLFGAEYAESGVVGVLDEYFRETRLKEALTTVIVTSYDIERKQAWFFRSRNASNPAIAEEYDFPMKQVARATSAAPTYFPPAHIPQGTSGKYWALVDGGVYANNPTMCAFVEALELKPHMELPEEICLVSLGTGQSTSGIPYEKARGWGLLGWARSIIGIALDGPGDAVHFQMSKLLRANYYRFQIDLTGISDAMDNADPSNVRQLEDAAKRMIDAESESIDKACSRLLANKFYPLSNKAIAEACGITSQAAARLLRAMDLPPEQRRDLLVGGEREPWYAPEVLALAQAASADRDA